MKINKQGKEELRAKVLEQLASVPDGQRVHLDKELLEELLFNTFTYNDGEKELFGKYIVWSGQFLSKIDLSEVSFDDVIWETSQSVENNLCPIEGIGLENSCDNIDLSNTNAKIDFSKSFYAKENFKDNSIRFCNFANTDLSNNELGSGLTIEDCDFSNTNININLNSENLWIFDTNMDGLDFSSYTVDESFFSDYATCFAVDCSLRNTGLNVSMTPNGSEYTFAGYYLGLKEIVGEAISKGRLDGCYVNGKKILTLEERQVIAQEKRAEYEKMKEDLIAETTSSIEQQSSGFGRK